MDRRLVESVLEKYIENKIAIMLNESSTNLLFNRCILNFEIKDLLYKSSESIFTPNGVTEIDDLIEKDSLLKEELIKIDNMYKREIYAISLKESKDEKILGMKLAFSGEIFEAAKKVVETKKYFYAVGIIVLNKDFILKTIIEKIKK